MGTVLILALIIIFVFGFVAGMKGKTKKEDDYLDKMKADLNSRMNDLNSMQHYTPDLKNFPFSESEYRDLNDRNSETEFALLRIIQLSSILDIYDAQKPIYCPENLDCYFESWMIMRFTTFEGKVGYDNHLDMINLAIGKYFIETYNFKWATKKIKDNTKIVLINTEKRTELAPLTSLTKCISNNQLDLFKALEEAYLANNTSPTAGVGIY